MPVFDSLLEVSERRGCAYLVLLDPDSLAGESVEETAQAVTEGGADGILVGGSMITEGDITGSIKLIKSSTRLPVIIFPGSAEQVSAEADALLFLSLLSGRNAEKIIGEQVKAAPAVKALGIECIPTAYLLVESGSLTAVQFFSGTMPIPRAKEEIASAHAIAAELMGMKAVYLEAGSGADMPVPLKMVSAVTKSVDIPVIVGGGIRSPETAELRARAGAHFIVTGTVHEPDANAEAVKEYARAVHWKE